MSKRAAADDPDYDLQDRKRIADAPGLQNYAPRERFCAGHCIIPATYPKDTPYRELLERHEIRVLLLLPGKFEDPLYALLEHVTLELREFDEDGNRPGPREDYGAISYAWGSSNKPHRMCIVGGGLSTNYRFTVLGFEVFSISGSKSTSMGRRRMHQPKRHRRAQRSSCFYGGYHEMAGSVLVWLGTGGSSDSLAFAVLQAVKILGLVDRDDLYGSELEELECQLQKTTNSKEHSPTLMQSDSTALSGLAAVVYLTRREWFHRLWTAQEAGMHIQEVQFCSGHFVCGVSEFETCLDLAHHSRKLLQRWVHLNTKQWNVLGLARQIFVESSDSFSANTVEKISQLYYRSCSDPRDRIYAVRRIFSLEPLAELAPDYNITPGELYRRFAWRLLTAPKHIIISNALALALVGTEEVVVNVQASWVADFHHLTAASHAKYQLYNCHIAVGMGSETHPYWKHFVPVLLSPSPNQLRLRGRCFAICIDRIPFHSVPSSRSSYRHFKLDPSSSVDLSTFLNWYLKFRALLCSTMSFDPASVDVDMETMEFLNYPTKTVVFYRNRLSNCTEYVRLEDIQELSNQTSLCGIDFNEEFRNWMHWAMTNMPECPLAKKRTLWRITSPHRTDIAWLPEQAQQGDQVCLFAGAPWPFVVRPKEDGTYTLVGDGYTHFTPLIEAIGGSLEDAPDLEFQTGGPLGVSMEGPEIDALLDNLDWITLS